MSTINKIARYEWQRIPEIWTAVRYQIDLRRGTGQFVMTGSRIINDFDLEHSGTGRIKRLRMRTMSLWESGRSTGGVSLGRLLDGQDSVSDMPDYGYEGMVRELVRGGWPQTVGMSDRDCYTILEGYCRSIVDQNFDPDGERPGRGGRGIGGRTLRTLMRSLARASASSMSVEGIRNDIAGHGGPDINIKTVHRYLDALRDICLTEDLQAWTPGLRSKTVIRTSDTRHLTDPAVAAYFLDAGPDDLIHDPNTLGLLFESMVVRDLRVYAQTVDGHVCHYRDKDGLEADAVVHLPGGRGGPWRSSSTTAGRTRGPGAS